MEPADRAAYVARYEGRLAEHGHSPRTLGWGGLGREAVRFEVMREAVEAAGAESVLDVGCGFADLHDHLRAHGYAGAYHGIDIVPGLLAQARSRDPALDLAEADVVDYQPGEEKLFDAVVASGVFNARLAGEPNTEHISRSVRRMFDLSRRVVCVDFMTTAVDFQHPDGWHTDPAWAVGLAQTLSRRFRLRNDYMPFEFALIIYRDDRHSGNGFESP